MALAGMVSCGGSSTSGDDSVPLPDRSFDAAAEASEEDSDLPGLPHDGGGGDGASDGPVYTGCNGALDCERVVFATTKDYGGGFGGIAEADQRCQTHADGSQSPRVKGRKFMAWVSTTGNQVLDRFPKGTKPYVLANGAVVANGWTDLTDGDLQTGIGLNEEGTPPGGSGRVWTGTKNNGEVAAETCGNWKNTTVSGRRGNLGGNGGGWSNDSDDVCSNPGHLYCFEY
jgi:hypothetical protein